VVNKFYGVIIIQLMPALKVNIIIVHPKGVENNIPKGEQL
jgi:hypothetical protein